MTVSTLKLFLINHTIVLKNIVFLHSTDVTCPVSNSNYRNGITNNTE